MAKRGKIVHDPEKHTKELLERDLQDIKDSIKIGILPLNPTRKFVVDERIRFGGFKEVYIREIGEDNLYYMVEAIGVSRERDKPARNEFHWCGWYELFPMSQSVQTSFAIEDKYYLRLMNSSIESLLHLIYAPHAGVDFDVEYQREHVWTISDKVALIESIFNNIDIGKFVFSERPMGTKGKLLEVIDGKQRLSALKEFYEDRYQYCGYYFSQLSFADRHKITGHGITYGYLESPTRRAVYTTFIKLNTCGKPMDIKHINKVKKLLKELDE